MLNRIIGLVLDLIAVAKCTQFYSPTLRDAAWQSFDESFDVVI
jgi:hypothetical protein